MVAHCGSSRPVDLTRTALFRYLLPKLEMERAFVQSWGTRTGRITARFRIAHDTEAIGLAERV
jgi:hypothetical protein